MGKNPLLFVITGDNKQECFMPCGGVENVADATRRRRGNPASRILFQVCYRDEENIHRACTNGYLTTANQRELREANRALV